MARTMSGPTIRIPANSVSEIAALDELIPLRINHPRAGHVARASTPAHAIAGKSGRKIQIASSTNMATRKTRPNNRRDDDCSMKGPHVDPLHLARKALG